MQKEWLTYKEAMAMFSMKRTALYNFLHQYHIRQSKPVGQVYVSYSDIMSVLEAKAVQTGI